MKFPKNLVDFRFGRFIVLERAENYLYSNGTKQKSQWLCECDCGNRKTILRSNLTTGKIKSCGCLNDELRIERNTTHGLSKSPLYSIWCGMKDRCFNVNDTGYKNYGGRGITICEDWLKFKNFHNDMAGSFFNGASIERVDVNGNYTPENCKWIAKKDQSKNRRSNHYFDFEGEKITLTELCRKKGKDYELVRERYVNSGWDIENALNAPKHSKGLRNNQEIKKRRTG